MEGSPLAEENVAQPNAGRTQSRETVCSRLSRVRQAALGERQLRAGLFERLCDAMIRGKSRMSQCSRTDPCGGASSDACTYRDPGFIVNFCGIACGCRENPVTVPGGVALVVLSDVPPLNAKQAAGENVTIVGE